MPDQQMMRVTATPGRNGLLKLRLDSGQVLRQGHRAVGLQDLRAVLQDDVRGTLGQQDVLPAAIAGRIRGR